MKSELFPAGIPRLNHVAMSLPAHRLGAAGRAEILDFYGDCFGWTEIEEQTKDEVILVMAVGHWDQFVFLHAEDHPMTAPRLDHFGVSVQSRDDMDAVWERISRWKAKDDRVDVIEPHVEDHDVVKIHSLYVKHLLPMMVEAQYWEFT